MGKDITSYFWGWGGSMGKTYSDDRIEGSTELNWENDPFTRAYRVGVIRYA